MNSIALSKGASQSGVVDVPVLLARERTRELGLAHTFRECAGASHAEIEDIVDKTITDLLVRPHTSEEGLFVGLRRGIKMRALRHHRDRAGRAQTLAHAAPVIYAREQARAWREDPERALIAREDDLIISEFLADLTKQEREVFVLCANGHSWRTIAPKLKLSASDARHLIATCERKRERFLAIYLHGRLCGYRSHTISSLLTGELSGERELALEQAVTHLNHCHTCQRQHNTTSKKLRASFDARVLALLPPPTLAITRSWLEHAQHALSRATHPLQRTPAAPAPEHAAGTIAGAGTLAKATVAILSAATIAGTTLIPHTSHRPHTPAGWSHHISLRSAAYPPLQSVLPAPTDSSRGHASTHSSRTGAVQSERMPFGPGRAIIERPSPELHRHDSRHRAPLSAAYPRVIRTKISPSPHVIAPPYTSTGGGPFTP